MRQNTRAPGAARATFSTSAAQSTANSRMPSAWARAMSRSFLMVLPKEMRSGVAPAASAISISATVAVSKQEPSEASSDSTSGAGLAFTA
jgi:hypothetical protein